MTNPVEVRADLVRKLRRDLVGPGPGPEDADLEREVLDVVPSRWYLTGYLAPQEELRDGDAAEPGTHADDDQPAEGPVTVRRYRPSSIGLTVLVPAETTSVDVVVTWGDYRTEPPLDD